MRLDMTNKGASEQLIGVTVDLQSDDAIEAIDHSTYDHMRRFCNYKGIPLLAKSEYAAIWLNATIELRDGINEENFEDKYKESSTVGGGQYDPSRMEKVRNYLAAMVDGDQFPQPVLMFSDGELIQVDGARRLMAMALFGPDAKEQVIIVIKRRDIVKILEPEFVRRVSQLHSTKKWFNNYQEIIELGLAGKRSYSGRFPNVLDFSLFEGKTIAEFACSNGMALFEAYFRGAERVVGFEIVQQNVDIINLMAQRFGIPVEAHRIDMNDTGWLAQVKAILPEWDYSVYLSTYRTLELKDRNGNVRDMWEGSKEGMIFEGHQQAGLTLAEYDMPVDTDAFYRDVFATKACLADYEVVQLPKGVIERPYDANYRPRYLLKRVPK
jgi:hypothetical protein